MSKRFLVSVGWFTAFLVTLIVWAKQPATTFDKTVLGVMLATVTLLTAAIVVLAVQARKAPKEPQSRWVFISYRSIALFIAGAAIVLLSVRFF